jgi:hypothetical protein
MGQTRWNDTTRSDACREQLRRNKRAAALDIRTQESEGARNGMPFTRLTFTM